MPGGLEYRDKKSEKSETLLNNIDIATRQKLDFLSNIRPGLLRKKVSSKISSESIEEIICVRSKDNKFKVIINGDYLHYINGDKAKPSWNLLFEVAEKKEVSYEPYYKHYLDYFNSNPKNKIYTQTGYKKTKILKKEYDFIRPSIKIDVISEKAFKTRLAKQKVAEK
jgi:hypothetical protein